MKSSNDLIVFAETGNLTGFQESIKNGVDINYIRVFGSSVLTNACRYGNLEIVKYLIENGANYDIINGKFRESFKYYNR